MSHWGAGYNGKLDQANINSIKLALLLAKKHFGAVHLITDGDGAISLSGLGFDSISKSLAEVDKTKKNAWSVGKIFAIREAARRFGHFIHIDNDCFLWKRPQDEILKSPIFSMCKEVIGGDVLSLNIKAMFGGHSKNFSMEALWMPNMSLCGGSDAAFWIGWADAAIGLVSDPALSRFWSGTDGPPYARAVLAEQWSLAAHLTRQSKSIRFIFPQPECIISQEEAEQAGISHLAHQKANPEIIERIARRLASNPPDLAMRANPSLPSMMKNLAQAATMYVVDGFKNCTKEEHSRRFAICHPCEYWNQNGFYGLGQCRKCGCSGAKLWVASSKCPIGKW